ncbi:MAG: AI-2E family transporter [Rikenellaceae bacterium]|jgi:predicted PurR-regulated permease PerM|nr:AI-2E family transporter [Rikenellaceae bacterium]
MLTGKEMNKQIRQVGFVILMVFLLCLMIFKLNYFISAALSGFTLYMLLRTPHRKLVARGWPKLLATITLLAVSVILLLGVGGGVVSILLPKIMAFKPQIVVDNVNSIYDFVLTKTGFNIFSKDVVDKAVQSLGTIIPNIFTATGSVVVNGFMSFVLLYFMLQGNRNMEEGFADRLPFKDESIDLIRHQTHNIVMSNAIGIPVIVIGHSIISGLAYWALGAGDPVVWGLITGLAGLVPVVGTAAIWIPLAINLMIGGDIWQGLVLIAYGALIVANTDNVLRMVLLKKYANVHPLVTLFGIILGLNLFGFWGIIFGPLMISGFMLMLKIYRMEFLGEKLTKADKEKIPGTTDAEPQK